MYAPVGSVVADKVTCVPAFETLIAADGTAAPVASITEGDPGAASERASYHRPWLTGTAPQGGEGVWVFSLT